MNKLYLIFFTLAFVLIGKVGNTAPSFVLNSTLTVTPAAIPQGSYVTVTAILKNTGTTTGPFDFECDLVTSAGTFISVIGKQCNNFNGYIVAIGGTITVTFNSSSNNAAPITSVPGSYRINIIASNVVSSNCAACGTKSSLCISTVSANGYILPYPVSVVASCTATTPTSCFASIGTPANGLEHHTNLSCSVVSGVNGYSYDYSYDGINWVINWNQSVNNGNVNVNNNDNPNGPIYYRVRTYCGSTYSGYRNASTFPIYTACDVPAAPTINGAGVNSLNIKLNTEIPVANPSYTTYAIYCTTTTSYVQANGSLGSGAIYQTKASWGTKTITGLTSGTNYCFYALAKNEQNDVRANSANAACGTTTGAVCTLVTAPNNLTATATTSGPINLSWTDNSNNETSFVLERSTSSGGTYSEIATLNTSTTSYSNSNVNGGTTYYYKVKACCNSTCSGYSNVGSATASQVTSTVTVTGTVTFNSNGLNGVTLSGSPGNYSASTNSSGNYTLSVPSGWSGNILPTLSNYTFTPTSRTYSNITVNQTSQNFTAANTSQTYTISGYVKDARVNTTTRLIELNPYSNCTIAAYVSGTTTVAGSSISSTDGSFSITGLQNNTYEVRAVDNSSNKVTIYNIPGNTLNIVIKIPKSLLNQINAYKNDLSSLTASLQALGQYPITSYSVSSQTSILDGWKSITANYDKIIEASGRLFLADKTLKEFYHNADVLNGEFAASLYELLKSAGTFIALFKNMFDFLDKHSNLNWLFRDQLEILADVILDKMEDAIDESLTLLPPEKGFIKSQIRGAIEILKGSNGLNVSIAAILNPIVERISAKNLLQDKYVKPTQTSLNSANSNASNLVYSGDFNSHYSQVQLQSVQASVDAENARIKSQYHREISGIIGSTSDVFQAYSNVASATGLFPFAAALRLVSTIGRFWSYAKLGQSYYVSLSAFDINKINLPPAINGVFNRDASVLVGSTSSLLSQQSELESAINLYDSALNEFRNDLVLHKYSNAISKYSGIIEKNKFLFDKIKEAFIPINAKAYNATQSISDFDSVFHNNFKNTLNFEPTMNQRFHFSSLALIADTSDIASINQLILFTDSLIIFNQKIGLEFSSFYPIIQNVNSFNYIQNVSSTVPKDMGNSSIKNCEVVFKNIGPATCTDLYAKISFDFPFVCNADSIYVGNLLPNQTDTISFNLIAPPIDTLVNYSVTFFSLNTIAENVSNVIISKGNKVFTFTGDGNWDNEVNWENKKIPPAVLPKGSEILIKPFGSGKCVLNLPQTISVGSKFSVWPNKQFIVQSNLKLEAGLPILNTVGSTTSSISNILVGGRIYSDGGHRIMSKGICYSYTPSPTIENNMIILNNDSNNFDTTLLGIPTNTSLHIRAFAINSFGTAYGNEIVYNENFSPSITICDQSWSEKNLDVVQYRNGDTIPQIQDPAVWSTLTTGAWCYHQNSTVNGQVYGKLYNWYAVSDPRGLAPAGWHIPTNSEWISLTDSCLGGFNVAGGKMKTTGVVQDGTGLWNGNNNTSTNSSGFAGIPSGYRSAVGAFANLNAAGFWWTATQSNTTNAFFNELDQGTDELSRNNISKKSGLSVRCVKD